jgi:hypothetical protein
MDIERINYLLEHPGHLDLFINAELGLIKPSHPDYIKRHQLKEMMIKISTILKIPKPKDEVIEEMLTDMTISHHGRIDREEFKNLVKLYLHLIKVL